MISVWDAVSQFNGGARKYHLKFGYLAIKVRPSYSCFRKCGWRETSSLGQPQIYFFNRFSRDIFFSFLVSFAYFWFLFLFCLFVCLFACWFLKLKMYILINIRLGGRVSDKKIFHPGDFQKQDLFLASP